jgi:hypothetical protein
MVPVHGIDRQTRPAAEKYQSASLSLLQPDLSILLALPLRVQHLPELHA